MTDAMTEFFGEMPNRPDHRDFWKLVDIVLALDGQAAEDPDGFADAVASANIDPRSVTYMAVQRSLRAYSGNDQDTRTALAATWLEGFLAGEPVAIMNAISIAIVILIITFMVFAIALCLIVARADRRADLLAELREAERYRTWKEKD